MAKMAIESIDGRGTPPIQESILAPVSPIASFFTRSLGFYDFGVGRTYFFDSTTWFWVFWTLYFDEGRPRQRMVNQWIGLNLQVGRVKSFNMSFVISGDWKVRRKTVEYGAWHSRGREVGAYILLGSVLVLYYFSFYGINSIIFYHEWTGIYEIWSPVLTW